METTLRSRVLHAYKTEQEWTSADPVLKVGEVAFSSDKYGYYKLGNGTSKWSELSYVIAPENDFTDDDSAKLGELNTYYGTCTVAQGTAAKTVSSVTGVNSKFNLVTGATIRVKFSNANTAASPTLNVCGTGTKNIKKYGTTASMAYMWQAGEIVEFVYDGTNYVMTKGGLGTTTYYGLVKLSSSTSSDSTSLAATASAVKSAYDLANTANSGLDNKVDKVDGKELSSNDFTDALLTKLNGIDDGANKYTLPVAGTSLGGVKSGTDITVDSDGNVSVKDDSHNHIISNVDGLQDALDDKVDVVDGKGLSSNDFTNALLTKLNGIAEGANNYTLPVAGTSIGGVKSGTDITVDSSGNVSVKDDSHNHVISNVDGLQTALDGKVDAVDGKVLSSNDFTDALKSRLEGIAAGAEVNQNAFSTVKVGTTSLSADSKTDTLTITAGDNITLTPTAQSDTFVIAATDTTYTPASATPKAIGTAAVGTSDKYAREDHVHNISLATGDSDGQVKVAGTNVSVKGLKSAAYTESSAYAASGHDHDATYLKTGAIGTAIPSSSDLDTYKTPGTYYAADSNVTKTLTNCPFTGSGFTLFVIRGYSTSRVCQVIVNNQNNVYRRYYNASSWTAWGQDYNSANKPTKSDLGLENVENKSSATIRGELTSSNVTSALGYTPAELDSNGFVLTSQLPSYVDDVVEGYLSNSKFYKESAHTTEITGETSKIYVDLSTNKTYRWSGSAFTEISASLALGETSSTAYRGDRGKTAYNHSQLTSGNPHNVTKSDVGLGNVDNTSDANKPISTATQTALDGKAQSDHDHDSTYLKLTGGTLSGNLFVERSDGGPQVGVTYTGANAHKAALHVSTAGNAGIYDITYGKWIVFSDKNGVVTLHGNADSATVLDTSRKIDGISFDGSADITHYGTCTTGASTKAKVVTCVGFTLVTGARIYVKFTNAQTYNGQVTLNVNSTGAKNVCQKGTVASVRYEWQAGEVIAFIYDGTNWLIENGAPATTTYYGRTKLSTSLASTATTLAATPSTVNALRVMLNNLPGYSSTATYAVGDRVYHNTDAYECTTAITTAEDWTDAHWTKLDPIQTQLEDAGRITTGTLSASNGGTGQTTLNDAADALINALPTGVAGRVPVDADYYISQYIGGGTTHTEYYRRPMSTLYDYVKGKTDSVYVNLTGTQTVSGAKTFSGENTFTGSNFIKNTNWIIEGSVTKGTNPGGTCYKQLIVLDKSADKTWNTTTHKRLQMLSFETYASGNTVASLTAYKNSASEGSNAVLAAVYDKTANKAYAIAPTYDVLTDSSTKIVTTAYLRSIFRHGTAVASATNCPSGCFYFQY